LNSPCGTLCVTETISFTENRIHYSLFALLDFRKLVVLDVLLYSIALTLEFAALIKLRRHRPDLERPFKIPGGWPGLTLTACGVAAFALAWPAAVRPKASRLLPLKLRGLDRGNRISSANC
jgi:amino acid transporter